MSLLLVLRHAPAQARDAWRKQGRPDALRPLTEEGSAHMTRIAVGLRQLLPDLRLILTSSLLRASQTAQLLRAAYGNVPIATTPALAPGARLQALAETLTAPLRTGACAVIGHEPDLTNWMSWALVGTARDFLVLKKGGAALLEFSGEPHAGSARLHWLLTPVQLARHGEKSR